MGSESGINPSDLIEGVVRRSDVAVVPFYDVPGLQDILERWQGKTVEIIVERLAED